ncbi:hypothetical protein [Delftia tsuruhatensis]|uniref:hypothetical protein n=1 Tax=Delftia tsuruhatensis TaxID=180282 RepID=UPI0030CAB57D
MATKHVISVSGGKDSTAVLLLAMERCPSGSMVPVFCDTDNEHQAVYDDLACPEHGEGKDGNKRWSHGAKYIRAPRWPAAAAKTSPLLSWSRPTAGSTARRPATCATP